VERCWTPWPRWVGPAGAKRGSGGERGSGGQGRARCLGCGRAPAGGSLRARGVGTRQSAWSARLDSPPIAVCTSAHPSQEAGGEGEEDAFKGEKKKKKKKGADIESMLAAMAEGGGGGDGAGAGGSPPSPGLP
jgi:hypothetical protein